MSCDIVIPRPRRSTPRSTSRPFRPWPSRGRRRCHDDLETSGGGVLESATRPGIRAPRCRLGAARFVAFCEAEGAGAVTADLARRWAASAGATPARAAWRLRIVRDFAIHHQAGDPRTEIPPKDLFPSRCHRKTPYLYSDEEVGATAPGSPGTSPWQRTPAPNLRHIVRSARDHRPSCR